MSDYSADLPNIFNPEDFKFSEPPPPVLYKYMITERVDDVLERNMVRFTHLVDTNDSFEVRKTFRRFAGPKLIKMMKGAVSNMFTPAFIERELKSKMAERGIDLPYAQVKEMFRQQFGMSIEDLLQSQMRGIVGQLLGGLDMVKTPEEFLIEIGSILMCFSLSERWDIATMWAHYGGNHAGVVVAFDTDHDWFKDDKGESKLQKIKYLDEQNDELFDDLQAAFSSKATDWAYEREWRINTAMKQIDKTIDLGIDKIHLRSFPPEAVHSVILGAKTSDATVEHVREILKRKYPWAKLQKATPQRMVSAYELQEI
ncbi:DUF2971 domain-containing protein [Rhizobium leguminosarum]|uniref:DUF2971 domain-containing protein n=1 Tax=Rhizobium leguminosarum TaxID=384 RepID=UPI001C9282B9|nr:DUF2971 domain-containing protein [Rhizobium leguminosarum]MBY2916173.1 DUF2971 domain-containing protein [Rhizobium leguminosarum]MBY2971408.1 DUF2971 domain-containing protein [Rhizobium leguminosarum]MBY2978810.1 DUF2971 domain-containing protein [Rhizobium leguminosarum]MBY3007361.1 DUF2971 domain-containing protein [Rhizobium leguminosarum]